MTKKYHDENPLPIDITDEFAEFEAWEQTADKKTLAEWEADIQETQKEFEKLPPEELAERHAFLHKLEYDLTVEDMEKYHQHFNPPLDNPFPHLTHQQMAEAEKLREKNCRHKPRCVCILTRFGSTQAKISADMAIRFLEKAIVKEVDRGEPVIFFYHLMERLNEIKVAERILAEKLLNSNIHMVLTVNNQDNTSHLDKLETAAYYIIMDEADYIKVMPESFTFGTSPIEHMWLINNCSKLIAALQSAHGSQHYLLEQAQKRGMEIENCLGDASAMMFDN